MFAPFNPSDSDEDQSKEKHFWALLAMVLFGVGAITGSFFIGFFIDRIGSKFTTIINLVIITLMGGLTIGFLYGGSFNALAWLMCFFWGFQDSAVNTHT